LRAEAGSACTLDVFAFNFFSEGSAVSVDWISESSFEVESGVLVESVVDWTFFGRNAMRLLFLLLGIIYADLGTLFPVP
jgi:hypothetical protein